MAETADLAELLAHADWLRGLARRLVGTSGADDAVQETYVAALHSPPDPALPARPWLARVLRNASRMGHRSAKRRERREQAIAAIVAPAPAVDDSVARAETYRMLVDLVLGLGEPYRTILIRHYFDGESLVDIARRDRIPEATVRGRHKHALDHLRAKLDARGDRQAWLASLAPLAAPPAHTLAIGALVMNKIVLAAVVALVAGGVAWRLYLRPPHTTATPVVAAAAASVAPISTAQRSGASEPAAPRHVVQLATDERTRLAARIQAAWSHKITAIPFTPFGSPGAPEPPGEMDKQEIRTAMGEVIEFMSICYEDNRASLKADHLAIHAHFTLTGDPDIGTVIDAKPLFDDADHQPLPPRLDDCLRSTLQTLELPPLAEGHIMDVDYPLLFADAPPDPEP